MTCPCGNNLDYSQCCQQIHLNPRLATSPESLMRARYTAFTQQNIDFLYDTFDPSTRRFQSKKDIKQWSVENKWIGLEVLKTTPNTVEFKAYYLDINLTPQVHHEKSNFKKAQDTWYYLDGIQLT